MELISSRVGVVAVAVALTCAVLAYLRDPPWLIDVTSGFRAWESSDDGRRFRWMSGRASFFVPADAEGVDIPMRAQFDSPQDWSVVASITIDDRPAERIELADGNWRDVRIRLPPPGKRRARRIDIHVNRTRPGERGLQVGEVRIVAKGREQVR